MNKDFCLNMINEDEILFWILTILKKPNINLFNIHNIFLMKSNHWPEVRRMRCLNLLGMYKKDVKMRALLSFRVKFHSQRMLYIYFCLYLPTILCRR